MNSQPNNRVRSMRKLYRQINGKLVDITDWRPAKPVAPMIMIDAYSNTPTLSPVDGSVLSSRGAVRNHNERNGVFNLGNDRTANRHDPVKPPDADLDVKKALEMQGFY